MNAGLPHRHTVSRILASIVAVSLGGADSATAQFGIDWLHLTQQTSVLKNASGGASDLIANVDEKSFAVADLDRDGWPDLVVATSVKSSLIGPREARLLLNEKGTLVDRTAQYAAASLSAGFGDDGFLEPVESADVEIGDLDGDGWDDVMTVHYDLTNDTSAAAKRLTHPRIYMNLGEDGAGNWLGLRHEDARIPQLKTVGASTASCGSSTDRWATSITTVTSISTSPTSTPTSMDSANRSVSISMIACCSTTGTGSSRIRPLRASRTPASGRRNSGATTGSRTSTATAGTTS